MLILRQIGIIPPVDEMVVLDHYACHTKHCYSCQRTVRIFDRVLFPVMNGFLFLLAVLSAKVDILPLLLNDLNAMKMKVLIMQPPFLLSFGLKGLALIAARTMKLRLQKIFKRFFVGDQPFKDDYARPKI